MPRKRRVTGGAPDSPSKLGRHGGPIGTKKPPEPKKKRKQKQAPPPPPPRETHGSHAAGSRPRTAATSGVQRARRSPPSASPPSPPWLVPSPVAAPPWLPSAGASFSTPPPTPPPTVRPLTRAEADYYAARAAEEDQNWAEAGFLPFGHVPGISVINRAADQLAEAAIYSPLGLYRAVTQDPRTTVRQVAHGIAEDFRHPGRYPGFLALDLLALGTGGAGAVARGAAAARAIEAGGARAAASALMHAPEPGVHTLRSGRLEVDVPLSRNALARSAQRAAFGVTERLAERTPGGRAERALTRTMGKQLTAERRITDAVARGDAAALARVGRKLSAPQQVALRVVAEGTPIEERILYHLELGNRRAVRLLGLARRYVTDGPEPRIRPEHKSLAGVYERVEKVAGGRDELLQTIGALTPEAAKGRVSAPARIVAGAKFERPLVSEVDYPPEWLIGRRVRPLDRENLGTIIDVDPEARVALVHFRNKEAKTRADVEFPLDELRFAGGRGDLVGGEEAAGAGRVRVPYSRRRGAAALERFPGVAGQGVIGYPRKPGSLTHQFEGRILASGEGRADVTRLVAESNLEAQRYAALLSFRERLREAAVPIPPEGVLDGDYVPMRLDALKTQPLPALRDLLNKADEGGDLTPAEKAQLDGAYDSLREELFPDPKRMSAEEQARFQQLWQEGKIGWVPRNLLDDLDKPPILLGLRQHRWGRRALATGDTINNAFRLAALYLKPAYAVPNILGNFALNLIQQGFAAPVNLARAARINRKLSADAVSRLDLAMGEGFARAIAPQGGLGEKAVQAAANVWSKGVDLGFRRSSFIYEARRKLGLRGAGTDWRKVEDLLTNPGRTRELVEVSRRANKAVIDYANLGPMEREIVRRVVLFYPWVKGSTTFAGHFAAAHPIKAAVTAELGQEGAAHAPEVPSYLEGSFEVAGGLSNPAAAAILQTPAQVYQAGRGLMRGDVRESERLSRFLTPAIGVGAAQAYRIDPSFPDRSYPKEYDWQDVLYASLIEDLPQVRLGRTLAEAGESQPDRLFPPDVVGAVGQFTLGGLWPRKFNRAELAKRAREEKQGSMGRAKSEYVRGLRRLQAERKWLLQKGGERRQVLDAYEGAKRDLFWVYAVREIEEETRKEKGGKLDYRERAHIVYVGALARLIKERGQRAARETMATLEPAYEAAQASELAAKEFYDQLRSEMTATLEQWREEVPSELERAAVG